MSIYRNSTSNSFKYILTLCTLLVIGCNFKSDDSEVKFKQNENGLFEGEIVLSEKRGDAKTEIIFTISDSVLSVGKG